MDTISKKLSKLQNKQGTLYFSEIDLKYENSQNPLHKDTKTHKIIATLTSQEGMQQQHINP